MSSLRGFGDRHYTVTWNSRPWLSHVVASRLELATQQKSPTSLNSSSKGFSRPMCGYSDGLCHRRTRGSHATIVQ